LRGHSGRTGGVGRNVLRGGDTRYGPMERRPRAPDSALQVLRLPDGVVARAGSSATRCPAHPATASAPHRAGGSTYVRSVTLQRRTWCGAIGDGEMRVPSYLATASRRFVVRMTLRWRRGKSQRRLLGPAQDEADVRAAEPQRVRQRVAELLGRPRAPRRV